MKRPDPTAAAAEFDGWAASGRDASMARGHGPATGALTGAWDLDESSVVLDVGCGNGWALRVLVARGAGRGVGVDASPAMVDRCRALTPPGVPARFEVALADALPLADESVTHVLNIESLYYYPDPAAALREWARVARPGARLGIMIDLYADNPLGQAWVEALDIGVHHLSEAEYCELVGRCGWSRVEARRVVDPSPARPEADFTPSIWSPSYELYLAGRDAGSLLIEAVR